MQKELELYEILYVVEPTFTEQETEEKIEYYQKFLTEKGSQVMVQNRGKRNLSYPIKGFETANYIQMFYLGNGELVKSLNKEIQRDLKVLRHMTTKLPGPLTTTDI
jgi:small subunit ribosomal protein S6